LNNISKHNAEFLARTQVRNEGGKGDTMARAPNHWGKPKSPNNVACAFFSTVHLLLKDLGFELRAPKLFLAPSAS